MRDEIILIGPLDIGKRIVAGILAGRLAQDFYWRAQPLRDWMVKA